MTTDTQDFSHLRTLAAEWLDRELDVNDFRCEGGTTSTNKLMRAYSSATDPNTVIALLDKVGALQAENERLRTSWATMAQVSKQTADLNDSFAARLAELEKAIADKGGDEHSPTQWAYDQACAALASAKAAGASPVEPSQAGELSKDELTDLITAGLGGTYHCTRVWSAWHVGTISEEDFEPLDESDTPAEIADSIIAAINAKGDAT